jgi:hypothetical protein
MREIIYIQAGSLANYAGTHFWNTQESYFTYGDEDESIVNHDLSFNEGRNPHVCRPFPSEILKLMYTTVASHQNQPILCPRLLAFDQKCMPSLAH